MNRKPSAKPSMGSTKINGKNLHGPNGMRLRGMEHSRLSKSRKAWMRHSDGFVLKMLKALYGLKQAGRTWYDTIHDAFVRDYGFTRMEADHCLYLVRRENGDFILVLLFVDDLALASNSRKMLDGFK